MILLFSLTNYNLANFLNVICTPNLATDSKRFRSIAVWGPRSRIKGILSYICKIGVPLGQWGWLPIPVKQADNQKLE